MTRSAASGWPALTALLLAACSAPSPDLSGASAMRPTDEPAMRLVGDERRVARRAPAPGAAVRFDVPASAQRAVVRAAAWRTGWRARMPGTGGSTTCRVRILRASGLSGEESFPVRVARGADDAGWSASAIPLSGAEAMEISCPDLPEDAVAWLAAPTCDGLAPPRARNVLLVSLDTLRLDAVGACGQRLPTTPVLDGLAREGTLWTQAVTPAPWTLPAHVSLMTGLLPSWHGRVDVGVPDRALPDVPTLAALLGAAGWETAAFTGRGSISWVLGATRDFQLVVEHEPTHGSDARECDASADRAIEWLRTRAGRPDAAPFLLFWHSYEPRWPYHDERFVGDASRLPAGIAEDARADWLRYLGDVAAVDAALGRVLAALDELGLEESTDVWVLSDHGEEFGEHSDGKRSEATRHGHGLWETLLRVPLVARARGIAPGRRDELVSLVDVFPTVLGLAGLPVPAGQQGLSLVSRAGRQAAQAEALRGSYVAHQQRCWREAGRLKHVGWLSTPPFERLYDLERDPRELRDVAALRPEETRRLREASLALWSTAPRAPWPGTSPNEASPPESTDSLRALGYVR